MKALVTGGRGFIGSFLVEELLRSGFEVNCLLRKKKNELGWLEGLAFNYIEGDLHNDESLKQSVKGVDYVFHLAGATKARNMEEFDRINADGTRNLLEATVKANPKIDKFVLVSSLAAVGPSTNGHPKAESELAQPISNYGRSKLEAEQIALSFAQKLPVAILRPP
nr:NAD(P)-dependent oxidoreductase [candidate division KSB1 bacterium]NIR71329.1 NAD(P)-dependent oxidoreductase [candidate division KSB1 bacterium]NIS24839.1 NAD(P)-dependent oxidoreductase [candidate division KSB1 bacterium]NIT71759.1 NAD(P)-dependent oxidoreductase [candidate division KSB1 bacterium]NIU25474.1 NAD(P)-dependent oxidoreductase [candidate division KSB1 bacterium]